MAKILVIDDDMNLLKMLELMLQRAGHQAILAADGAEGIEMAAKDPPDLAIVDVMMPEMSGHEICRQLRARPATVEIPILILTARSQPADREAALQSGATDYMAKPVSPKDLAAKVDELLAPSDAQRTGRVITLCSLRGGVGVSTMSVSLAGALRAQQVPNVTLVDLSPNSGHVALHLRIQPKRSWTQMLGQTKLTTEGIRSLLIRHPSGLNLLAAPISSTSRTTSSNGSGSPAGVGGWVAPGGENWFHDGNSCRYLLTSSVLIGKSTTSFSQALIKSRAPRMGMNSKKIRFVLNGLFI